MRASELRIGNLVKYQDNQNIFEISLGVQDDIEETWIELGCFEPIPLTEEWHDKFGVKLNGFMSFEYVLPRKNNIDVVVIFDGDYVMIKQGKEDIVSIWNKDLTKRDMYVHEWQNLYFALTNQELTLNTK